MYIAGDGASWIKAGCDVIAKSRFVLDKFHLSKYISKATAHLLDSQADAKQEIYDAIYEQDKLEVRSVFKRILNVTTSESKQQEIKESLRYLINHWEGIAVYVEDGGAVWGCCAEGR